ncbi:MAG: hypothetical protein AAB363_11530, partial [Planctomycetota bacterium]
MDDAMHSGEVSLTARKISRREMLGVGGALLLGGGIAAGLRFASGRERGYHADVFIGRAPDYQTDLSSIVQDGLSTLGIG